MNASSRHVGGDEGPGPAVGKGGQGPFTLGLGLAPVDGQGLHATGVQLHGHPIRTATGSAEDERSTVLTDEPDSHRDSVLSRDIPEQVRDVGGVELVVPDVVASRIGLIALTRVSISGPIVAENNIT